MLLHELKNKIRQSGGRLMLKTVSVKFTEDDVHFYREGEIDLIGYISAKDNSANILDVFSFMPGSLNRMDQVMEIADYFGAKIEKIVVEKEIIKEDKQKDKLAGMVEAYEKLLINRPVTIGK